MKIGIIGAMEEEVEIIKKNMKLNKVQKKAKMEFYEGEFKSKNIVVVKSGIGKVNAAACAQILIDDFNVDLIINTGVAGGVKHGIKPLDVVISSDLVEHDADGTACNYKPGQIPRMDVYSFKADEKLISLAKEAAKKSTEFSAYVGRIISGDQIIADSNKLEYFRETFNASAVEMEGAAIGHVCYLNAVPFVVIRSISDSADEKQDMDYDKFVDISIKNSVSITSYMIENL